MNMTKRVVLPETMAHLFWDADMNSLDVREHSAFIIERVLNLGDDEAIRWIFAQYGADEIRRVVCESRRLSRKTARCWQNAFCLGEDEMRCFGVYSMNPDGYF